MDEAKAHAIRLGEAAGEEYAMQLYREQGIGALAATLRPRPFEGYAAQFYELWPGGQERWQELAFTRTIATSKGAHPYYVKAFDEVFARGARRCAEMFVRGYLDARAGVPFSLPPGETIPELKARLELRQRRIALGDRQTLIDAYETGHRLFTEKEADRG